MTDWPDHFCPGCGTAQRAFPRYPWYFCQSCLKRACDQSGRHIRFGNEGFSGGLEWRFDGEDQAQSGQPAICLIDNRPVAVTEARFGGVVAQPIPDDSRFWPKGYIDLRRGPPPTPKPKGTGIGSGFTPKSPQG